ncbi:putative RNA-binding protein 19-like protein [Dinothrombium tinctorium]|uniref:Putative RNA-binding protein 19-like protein n=1 Tax=Dinothrombium tinctorium TaxID=1965070 RepID=A0A443RLN0_9ACAR|nr:putative RNA-binding protein 19-like protein [Dinothrombium tinctorium]
MSRLIVKNLPKNITREKLESSFSMKGTITDLQLKFSKNGVFRQFAFVGYKSEEEAKAAKEYFDKTYVGNAKISVEFCKELGASKPYNAPKKRKLSKSEDEKVSNDKEMNEKSKKKVKLDPFAELKDDKEFSEFLKVQRNLGNEAKQVWGNDFDIEKETANTKKSEEVKKSVVNVKEKPNFEFTVKLRGLPYNCKKKNVRDFFQPLKPISIRLPPKIKGIAFVSFATARDLNQSLIKHRGFLDGHRIDVVKYEVKAKTEEVKKEDKVYKDNEPAEEDICESGRIFIRNLCYSCTEDDLEKLFSKYGPISEIHLPIDSFTKKLKGFAFITFMFPEHAVKAYAELDGSIFLGRLLHLIPAKAKPDKVELPFENEGSSFKKEKGIKQKAEANKSHNWNTLFLGANAVADVMVDKYGVKKSELVADKESKESIAVRMALGETQLVNETKKFLELNGIKLDSFKDLSSSRSKTVLLAKNLPAGTKAEELQEIFSKHGLVKRVLLPPFGITAIIEMQEPTEAKLAFRKLAYSNFKHIPLYLEWAPNDVFDNSNAVKTAEKNDESVKTNQAESEEKHRVEESDKNKDEKPEEDTTIFIKNLNFKTDEESIRKHFEKCGKIYNITVARKKHPSGRLLPIGYGFIQFQHKKSAKKAMKELQNSLLDDRTLELKLSRNSLSDGKGKEKRKINQKEPGTKILIRNIPFEATVKDVKELFSSFGDLKSIRLPKKLTGSHRGFGFAEFATKSGAKKAFESLCESTHLYGRRLVLEWANEESGNALDFARSEHFGRGKEMRSNAKCPRRVHTS